VPVKNVETPAGLVPFIAFAVAEIPGSVINDIATVYTPPEGKLAIVEHVSFSGEIDIGHSLFCVLRVQVGPLATGAAFPLQALGPGVLSQSVGMTGFALSQSVRLYSDDLIQANCRRTPGNVTADVFVTISGQLVDAPAE
jgi:hypothetical protein